MNLIKLRKQVAKAQALIEAADDTVSDEMNKGRIEHASKEFKYLQRLSNDLLTVKQSITELQSNF